MKIQLKAESPTRYFLEGVQKIVAVIFEKMMTDGLLKKDDPEMLSFVFATPVTSLVHLSDRELHKKKQISVQIEKFVKHFISTYAEK